MFGCESAGGARRLAAEALDELLVLGEAVVQQLDRDLAAELLVLGQYTSAMPPEPTRESDPVAAVDRRAGAISSVIAWLPSSASHAPDAGDRRGDRAPP